MPDFSSLIIGASDFSGLTNAVKMDEQRKDRQYQINRQEKAQRSASAGFLQDYTDSKQYLTGGDLDPVIVANLQNAEKRGMEMVAAGADAGQIYQALAPIMQNVTKYRATAKQVNSQLDEQIKLVKERGGNAYDIAKLQQAARERAYYTTGKDGKRVLNPDNVDPSRNYVMEVIQESPELVTSSAGIDDFVKNDKSMVENQFDVTEYSPTGGLNRNKIKTRHPGWMQPEFTKDPATGQDIYTGAAPKYDTAIDENGKEVLADFPDGKGGTVKGPVRLLEEQTFDSIVGANPGIADWVRGQVNIALKEHKEKTGEEISIKSDKAKIISRGLLYTELNGRGKQSYSRQVIENKPGAMEANIQAQKNEAPFIIQLQADKAGAAQSARQAAMMDPEYAAFRNEQDLKAKQNTQTAKTEAETAKAATKKETDLKPKVEAWKSNDSVSGSSTTNKYYKGKKVDGKEITDVEGRPLTQKFRDPFAVTLKDANGNTETKTFKTKKELFNFLEKADSGTVAPATGGTVTKKLTKKYGLD